MSITRTRTAEHNRKIGDAHLARGRGMTPKKQCPECKRFLERSRFGVRPNGYTESYCVRCRRARANKYVKNRKKYERGVKERYNWYNRKATLKRNHGITIEDYERFESRQNGVCAICQQPESYKGKRFLSVDHCHTTGLIRGLLCSPCNKAIGLMQDNPSRMESAAAYLRLTHTSTLFRVEKHQ